MASTGAAVENALNEPKPEVLSAYASQGDRALAERSRSAASVYFLVTLLIAFTTTYYRDYPFTILAVGTITLVNGIARMLLAFRIFRAADEEIRRLRVYFRATIYVAFVSWGMFSGLSVRLYPGEWASTLALLSAAGFAGGGSVSLASDLKFASRCLVAMLAPISIAGVATGTSESYGVAVGTALYLAFLLSQTRSNWLTYRAAILAADAEQARRRAEDLARARSDFLAQMSHEIRTPMSGVLGMLELLLDSELSPEQRYYAECSHTSAKSLMTIVNPILDLSKIDAGGLELERVPFDLVATVHSAVAPVAVLAARKGVSVDCSIEASLGQYYLGDPIRLGQILANLTVNAARFTVAGQITVEVAAAVSASGLIKFEVRDTGIGIPAEAQARLFQSYGQADPSTARLYGGTGLGLSISKRLVEMMGGAIEVESAEGVGSTFRFTIPLDKTTPPAVEVQPRHGPAPGAREASRVLVAEDNLVSQLVIRRLLEKLGCKVDIAADGLEALEAVSHVNYDLVLMDCQMPRLDGLAATRRIRSASPGERRVPIVALTARAMAGEREECLAAGMDAFLIKPISVDSLAAAISPFLSPPPPSPLLRPDAAPTGEDPPGA